jgi:aminoglycoside phosphotransferase (APT) family kinase protein
VPDRQRVIDMVVERVGEVDVTRLRSYLATALRVTPGDVTFAPLAGGRSNLTWLVSAGIENYVLRRPPLHGSLATAHDMAREFLILGALSGSEVPVPEPVVYCEDDAVFGAPFYVMRAVPGTVVREEWPPDWPVQWRAVLGRELITMLGRIHAFDWQKVLATLARPEGYVPRQLRRLSKQWSMTSEAGFEPLEQVWEALHQYQGWSLESTLIHGDYRLNNVIVDMPSSMPIAAVLDWELATIGDPLADLALVLSCWPMAGDPPILLESQSPASRITTLPGFLPRAALVEIYVAETGRDLADFHYYEAFALARRAVIAQGIYYRSTLSRETDSRLESYRTRALSLSEAAAQCLTRIE